MESTQVIENNKLIAEFMGFERYPIKGKNDGFIVTSINNVGIPVECCGANLSFNSSWDWLMPVVEKIETLEFKSRTVWTTIKTFKTSGINNYHEMMLRIYNKDGESFLLEYNSEWFDKKIDAVYNTVIEFIKWYNLNKDA